MIKQIMQVNSESKIVEFTTGDITVNQLFITLNIENFNGATVSVGNKVVGLGVTFSGGLAKPEINKQTGDIIYIDNRDFGARDARQKRRR